MMKRRMSVMFFTVAIGLQLLVAPTGVVIPKRHATFLRKYVSASLRVAVLVAPTSGLVSEADGYTHVLKGHGPGCDGPQKVPRSLAVADKFVPNR